MNEFNEMNQKDEKVVDIPEDKIIPAIVKTKKKGSKAKVIILTAAVALASFGGGSLYTSYQWIQDQQSAIAEAAQKEDALPSNNINQTSASTNMMTGTSIADIAKATENSVVEITTESVENDMFMRQYVSKGAGSGVVISKDGYIVTNNHVINGASKIVVRLKDGKEHPAKLIGTDSQTDLAVIKVEGATLTPATYGNSDQLAVGEPVVAIGNPLGSLGGTVTNGIISATDRQITLENQTMTLLQTNAAINPGNSGGGLFNSKGELIGVVVAKTAATEVEGIGFAIPVNVVKNVVSSIMDVGYVQGRPVLGVKLLDVHSAEIANYYGINKLGIYITELTKGTKAEAGGLKVGDCIIAVDNTQIGSFAELKGILNEHKVGDKIDIIVSRQGKLVNLTVELSESVPEPVEETKVTTENKEMNPQQFNNAPSGQDILFDIFGRR